MKKLLILGAMGMHVPLIKRAKELGYYTITSDYLPENPGHAIADEAHYDSTTDLSAVLKLAKDLNIDGIMTYNSDPAAPTAAYVAEQLGLPGNPYQAVKIMSEKDLFRKFLKTHNLNVPAFFEIDTDHCDIRKQIPETAFPLIIKPVDSSGSKGVTVVHDYDELEKAIPAALERSRCKRIIVEEYIEPAGRQLHGDGFIENGILTFLYLGDHHFDTSKGVNNFVPYSTTYPSEHSADIINACKKEIQSFITAVGLKNGGFNVELRVSKKNNKVYIIDIGARNGGNFTPKVIEYATGFNFMDCALAVAMGNPIPHYKIENNGFTSHLILHSSKSGVIKQLWIDDEIRNRILESHIYVKPGDIIEPFIGANAALGVLIMRYESREIMNHIVDNFEQLYKVFF